MVDMTGIELVKGLVGDWAYVKGLVLSGLGVRGRGRLLGAW